jgi:hypothetical protein
MINDLARILKERLGLEPGRDCIVGGGLVSVDLGIYHEPSGQRVAVQVNKISPSSGTAAEGGAAAEAAVDRRAFAESRATRRVLESFGWRMATVAERDWLAAGEDEHKKLHLTVAALNDALGGGGGGGGGHDHQHGHDHTHSGGCGCKH